MKINLHTPVEEVQVQLIPLIDVIFCILTFFLLAALQFTRQQAINVDLPKATTGTTAQIRDTLIVTVDSVGQIYVEQEPVTQDLMYQRLQAYRATNPAGMMILNASRTSSYNDVVQVLDRMREVGGDRVALATLPGTAEQPAGNIPYIPNAPTTAPTAPVDPLAIPSAPLESPLPTPAGQSPNVQGNTINPRSVPAFPTVPAPQAPTSPQR